MSPQFPEPAVLHFNEASASAGRLLHNTSCKGWLMEFGDTVVEVWHRYVSSRSKLALFTYGPKEITEMGHSKEDR